MNLYAPGNLVGRLLISYVIVWTIMLVISKLEWRGSFRRTHRWHGAISIMTVYVLGLIAFIT